MEKSWEALKQAVREDESLVEKDRLREVVTKNFKGIEKRRVLKVINSAAYDKFVEARVCGQRETRRELLAEIREIIEKEHSEFDEKTVQGIMDFFIYVLDIAPVDGDDASQVVAEGTEQGLNLAEEDQSEDSVVEETTRAGIELGSEAASSAGFEIQQKLTEVNVPEEWECICGQKNQLSFCVRCGKRKALSCADNVWQCECGKRNFGAFCTQCGKEK